MDRDECLCAMNRAEEIEMHRQQVRRWAREIMRHTSPVEGGFAGAPIYPVLPAFAPGCGRLCPAASALLESR